MAIYGYTAYSAAKYGVRGLAEVLDMEVRCHNIAVSISYPPEVDTPMLQVRGRERGREGRLISLFLSLSHTYACAHTHTHSFRKRWDTAPTLSSLSAVLAVCSRLTRLHGTSAVELREGSSRSTMALMASYWGP